MKLQLLDAIGEITEARTAAGLWQQGQGCSLTGLSGAAKTVFLAALDRLLPEQGSLVFLLSGRDDIREYRRTLNCFYSDLLMQELYPVDLPLVPLPATEGLRQAPPRRGGELCKRNGRFSTHILRSAGSSLPSSKGK